MAGFVGFLKVKCHESYSPTPKWLTRIEGAGPVIAPQRTQPMDAIRKEMAEHEWEIVRVRIPQGWD